MRVPLFVCSPSCCQTARSTWWRWWTPSVMLSMQCRRRMWVWRLGSRPIYRELQPEGLASKGAPMVRKKKSFSLTWCDLLIRLYRFVWCSPTCFCICNTYIPMLTLNLLDPLYVILLPMFSQVYHSVMLYSINLSALNLRICIQWNLNKHYQYVTLGYISFALFSGLTQVVDFIFLFVSDDSTGLCCWEAKRSLRHHPFMRFSNWQYTWWHPTAGFALHK